MDDCPSDAERSSDPEFCEKETNPIDPARSGSGRGGQSGTLGPYRIVGELGHGGMGVVKGTTVERLYREIRALRIYEGTSEIQKLIIAETFLKD